MVVKCYGMVRPSPESYSKTIIELSAQSLLPGPQILVLYLIPESGSKPQPVSLRLRIPFWEFQLAG